MPYTKTNWVNGTTPVNATNLNKIENALEQVFGMIYPVGSIYMSVNSTNPSTYFGGTWVAWGSGRVPVGVNTSDTSFNTVEKTGGHKEIQAHSHTISRQWQGTGFQTPYGEPYAGWGVQDAFSSTNPTWSHTSSYGGGNSGNLQPYITCYMWKRTA